MFAKNKPTKRVDLGEGNWVELQHLSKGQRDALQSATVNLVKDVQYVEKDGQRELKEGSNLPDDFLQKTNEIAYQRLTYAIKSWSAEGTAITAETVGELDEEAFDKILTAVNEMNELTKEEEKN